MRPVHKFNRGAVGISIHAPHEGVRRSPFQIADAEKRFQSTHPTRGCDEMVHAVLNSVTFQSTHPTRGCDNQPQQQLMYHMTFQSTHPTRGCDQLVRVLCLICQISIHAPHEGVRPEHGKHKIVVNISIHAPPEGVRLRASRLRYS